MIFNQIGHLTCTTKCEGKKKLGAQGSSSRASDYHYYYYYYYFLNDS